MVYDYDKLYGETRDALGLPNLIFVDFFDRFEPARARVLDVGCGQGRDALFIARKGHDVVGVDISPNGIRDLKDAAEKERLFIQGVVADIETFSPDGVFDVILIDRTLHILAPSLRLSVVAAMLGHVGENGWLLIADEPSNIKDFETTIMSHDSKWKIRLRRRGYLFVQRA